MIPLTTLEDVNEGWRNALKYVDVIGGEVVNESQNPDDKYHVGKLLLKVFKKYPDHVIQIDANTGESETNESFSCRTIRAALGLRLRGLKRGDVVIIAGPNHIHVTVPLIACQYDGIIAYPIDRTWKEAELTPTLETVKPKIIFCQNAYTSRFENVIKATGISCKIITFDKNDGKFETFDKFLAEASEQNVQSFKSSSFDPTNTIAILYSTSGSTGMSKAAAFTQKSLLLQSALFWYGFTRYPQPMDRILISSPMQWATGSLLTFGTCLMVVTRVLTSVEVINPEIIMKIVHKYRPSSATIPPSLINLIIHHPDVHKYDMTSIKRCQIGGMASHPGLLEQFQNITRGEAYNAYGITELGIQMFNCVDTKAGSTGRPFPFIDIKLINSKTGKEVENFEPGEILFKAECMFKGYYNKPEETKAALTEDGYVKSGDIFYRDTDNYFFFVDRVKSMLKFNSHQVSPSELEMLIKTLPGVIDAAVTGVPHSKCGDVVVAFVVRSNPVVVNEDMVKGLIAEKLAPSKRLRGGVRFVESLPMTSTAKLDRTALRELAINTVDVTNINLD